MRVWTAVVPLTELPGVVDWARPLMEAAETSRVMTPGSSVWHVLTHRTSPPPAYTRPSVLLAAAWPCRPDQWAVIVMDRAFAGTWKVTRCTASENANSRSGGVPVPAYGSAVSRR